jgi:molybdopterin-dependent oxidoreductase alpha subunit
MWKAMRSKNTCKTCAVGMGGQLGGMVNEGGYFPEVCKKSFQAMASDMQGAIRDEFFAKYSINQLMALSPRELEASGRLVKPLVAKAGDTHFQPIEWDDAIGRIASRIKDSGPERSFFYVSGRSSNEAGFLTQMMARLLGTNYVNNCSYYCHQASGVGLASSIGSGAGTVQVHDLDNCDLYVLIGANPASNHPRLMRSLMNIRRGGGKVVVINPMREAGLVRFKVPSDVRSLLFGTKIASSYIQPNIGGDLALLTGVAKIVIAQNAHDVQFIQNHTEGFDQFKAQVDATSWDEIETLSGVSRKEITQLALQYNESKNAVFAWAMGVTHHAHGTQTVQMIANIALLRAMVGRRNAGVMPIRGHSNVQGMGSVGVTPKLKEGIIKRFEERLGVQPPTSPGYDTMACMKASQRGEMDFALCLGGNLYGSNPDLKFAAESMSRLKQLVYMSTTLNTGHAHARGEETIILPVLPRDEEPQPTTQESMFSFVRLSDGGKPRMEGPRSEVSILAEIGRGVFGGDSPVDWKELESHSAVRKLIADLIPGYEDIADIDETKKEFYVAGRSPEDHRFQTPSGRAKFHAIQVTAPMPKQTEPADGAPTELRLMTVRSEGQFNTVVYDEEDIYRNQTRRDVILMNQSDLDQLGIAHDQRVRIKSATSEMRYITARAFDVRAGNAVMYYPEANVLVSTEIDEKSRTPAFKCVPITVEPEPEAD